MKRFRTDKAKRQAERETHGSKRVGSEKNRSKTGRWANGPAHGGGNNCMSCCPKVILPEPVLPRSESIDRDNEPLTPFEEIVIVWAGAGSRVLVWPLRVARGSSALILSHASMRMVCWLISRLNKRTYLMPRDCRNHQIASLWSWGRISDTPTSIVKTGQAFRGTNSIGKKAPSGFFSRRNPVNLLFIHQL